jgi:DNA-binding CsgD family transcriptional regulator/tetratricopeptide (TPR) repeat protein
MLMAQRSGIDGRARYSMLETLRAYGSRLLDDKGERSDVQASVASWTLRHAEETAALFHTPHDGPIAAWGDAEQENLRMALDWLMHHDAVSAARLATAIAPWWFLRGHYREGTFVLEQALELSAAEGVPDDVVVGIEEWLARLYSYSGHFPTALDHYSRVDDLLKTSGPAPMHVDSLIGQTIALFNLGQMSRSKACADSALEMAHELPYTTGECYAAATVGVIALYEGDFSTALERAEEAMHVDRSSVSGHAWRWAMAPFGESCAVVGQLERAEKTFEENLELCRQAGDRSWTAFQLERLARIYLMTDRREQALPYLGEAIRISFDIGDRLRLSDCFASAVVASAPAYPHEAAMLWGAGRSLSASLGIDRPALADIVDQAEPSSIYDSAFLTDPMIRLRGALGVERAASADWEGAAVPLDAAVDLALSVLSEPVVVDRAASAPLSKLSKRERQVLDLLAQGKTDAQIAETLFISIRTVRSHLDRIRDKTGCRRRAELIRLTLEEQT